ncbi:hypothetical protein [Phaeovulum vinaykumarii]|uniref:Uncharacterized protein n=1 Tax=Phaeovulum vinaykumarii TaxID=407234 RepID=A0A1N7KPD3_9RHOB|nr:hypothetical protein [Phaeovulum vinaykumarii]SIS63366.1 hypothetical protein SAMN05421795_1027 [Phaeovulum vinaykumarii]SOC01948.1 hypothetical protein SAMN05878426_102767 [Phaeovulum vinaykumarii]
MAFPKNCIRVHGENIVVYDCGHGRIMHHAELLRAMERTRSLAQVKKAFPASRRNLLDVLNTFGFDFDQLLAEQFAEGLADTKLAGLHRVDAKWIAKKRVTLGQTRRPGRPATDCSDQEVIRAYESAGSYAAAARSMKLDPRTFRRLYFLARSRTGQNVG